MKKMSLKSGSYRSSPGSTKKTKESETQFGGKLLAAYSDWTRPNWLGKNLRLITTKTKCWPCSPTTCLKTSIKWPTLPRSSSTRNTGFPGQKARKEDKSSLRDTVDKPNVLSSHPFSCSSFFWRILRLRCSPNKLLPLLMKTKVFSANAVTQPLH